MLGKLRRAAPTEIVHLASRRCWTFRFPCPLSTNNCGLTGFSPRRSLHAAFTPKLGAPCRPCFLPFSTARSRGRRDMSKNRAKTFGESLRERRLAKGYSLRKFAELVGVSPTYLSQVEQGNVVPPTAERVSKDGRTSRRKYRCVDRLGRPRSRRFARDHSEAADRSARPAPSSQGSKRRSTPQVARKR